MLLPLTVSVSSSLCQPHELLFDENLSHKLVWLLADFFFDSIHVRDVGLKAANDPVGWEYAKDNDLMIVSKDSDMHQRSFVFGHPPKVVWVRLGNCQHWTLKDYCEDTLPLSKHFTKMITHPFLVYRR